MQGVRCGKDVALSFVKFEVKKMKVLFFPMLLDFRTNLPPPLFFKALKLRHIILL
jgi:hypothetical protein